MKKIFLFLVVLFLFSACAQAEIVGRTQESYIHSYTAENGQTIYFLSREEEPYVRMQDVNFDGHDDIVVLTALGASNGFFEFFVWDADQYVLAMHVDTFENGLPNYVLYPEKGIVLASESNGWAGLLHKTVLFYWEGTTMRVLRKAVCETLPLPEDGVSMCVTEQAWDGQQLQSRVLWEATWSTQEAQQRSMELLDEEEKTLWNGL